MLRRRKVKLKTGRPRPGRPRHEKADEKEQEAFRKKFAEKVSAKGEERSRSSGKPLKVMAFDEARFGLINWHRRRYYCPKGFSPYTVRRAYEWTYLSMRPRGPYDGRELVRVVPAGHGRPVFFGGVLGATGQRSIR